MVKAGCPFMRGNCRVDMGITGTLHAVAFVVHCSMLQSSLIECLRGGLGMLGQI